ncbi:MAG: amidohydrolase family protein [Planctomycetaceae bacterium]|jgi:predicted TIM-barrel fold metal-dependent hydrolase|nr:amidohydrolase family protein [Planctomycetaceae bacterium]MCE2811748.1 amidohydrolase family protein [Planctomycetaceae bacterium]
MPNRIDRRGILTGAGAVALSAGLLNKFPIAHGATFQADQSAGYVDSHVHVWPKLIEKYPLDSKYTTADVVPVAFPPEEIMQLGQKEGVQRVVLIQMSFFGFDNSYMLDCISKWPKVFRGVAIIDHDAPGVPEKMIALKRLGVRGYRLYANAKNVASWDGSPGIDAMFKTAAQTQQAICLLSDPEVLPGIDKMASKYPNTKIVIDHFSRIGMKGQIDQGDLEKLCKLGRFENVFVKTSAFYALGQKKAPYKDLLPMIKQLRDAYSADRLMWGSDCPYQVQDDHTYPSSFSLIAKHADFLSENERIAILGKTADRVFFQD